MTTMILIAIAATLIAFLLTAADTALTHLSRHRAEQLNDEGRSGSAAVVRILTDSAPYLAVATFVRGVAEATVAVAVTVAVDMQTGEHWRTALISIAIMSVVSFVIVGVSPRTLGRQHNERVALMAAPVVLTLHVVLGPLAKLLILFGNALTPGRGYSDGPFSSESDLRDLVDLAGESAVIEADEREMIHSIFELGDTVAREVMVPRPDIVWVHQDKVLRKAQSLFLRSGYSRIPVVGESTDDVRGLLYFKDVVRELNSHPELGNQTPVAAVMKPVQRIPESKPVDSLLRDMQRDRQHFAIVIDEYGGTAGLITIEDVLEEIVGEIADEHDREVADEPEDLGDGRVRVPASMSIDDFAELFQVEIETEDADTVGGLLAAVAGQVPIVGTSAVIEGLELTAERLAGRRRRVAAVLVRTIGARTEDTQTGNTRTGDAKDDDAATDDSERDDPDRDNSATDDFEHGDRPPSERRAAAVAGSESSHSSDERR